MSPRGLLPLPTMPVPAGTRCFLFQVPDDNTWVGLFFGSLYQLSVWSSYDRDTAHTAADVAAAWLDIINTAHEGCMAAIQFEQDTCLLKVSFDNGATFSTIFDAMQCIQSALESGLLAGGSSAPIIAHPPVTCTNYFAVVGAASGWTLPVRVSEFDTIRIVSEPQFDIWSDNLGVNWFCPDGTNFAVDTLCGAGEPAHSGDPDSSQNHMRLILMIDSTPYDIKSGTITVPSGVHNATARLMANDSVLWDNLGNHQVNIEHCAQVTCLTDNFIINAGPWSGINHPPPAAEDGSTVTWILGTGWRGDLYNPVSSPTAVQSVVDVKQTFGATKHVTTVRVVATGPTNSTYGGDWELRIGGVVSQFVAYAASIDHTFTVNADIGDVEIKCGRGAAGSLNAPCVVTLITVCNS